MTAEIAILNKLAIALATDSAVTISSGDEEQKTYDSADKLFDLSYHNPLGIMIFNGLQFMQAPLPMIITEYRGKCKPFATVKEAAYDFLKYLNEWGKSSPAEVEAAAIASMLHPMINALEKRVYKRLENALTTEPAKLAEWFDGILSNEVAVFMRLVKAAPPSSFIDGKPNFSTKRKKQIRDIVADLWSFKTHLDAVVELSEIYLQADVTSGNHTGIVIAGFGSDELFPTLISFNIEGMIFGRLKYKETNLVDIDRRGTRARVIPFAQKEMVDRFLYGLDENIERQITTFCKATVPEISQQLIDSLEMPEEDKAKLLDRATAAEQAFIEDLKQKEFESIRSDSRNAIEGLVEFMPKPEMARMAEALVNLTSLKRRVSRGMDTVGGPIDVAVISRTEGFIWVKRKHYFSPDLNPRYLSKIRRRPEVQDGSGTQT